MSIHVHASKKWVSVCICFGLFRDVYDVYTYLHVFVRYVCVHIHLQVIKMCQYTHISKCVCVFVHVHTRFGLFRSIDMYWCVCEMCTCVHLCGCV